MKAAEIIAARWFPPAKDEAEHFYVCECGQAVDYRRLGDVLHHEEPGHKPTPTN